MEIKTDPPMEQMDVAVDLGVVAPGLPEILTLEQLCAVATPPPRFVDEGILRHGCKMILGGTSNSNKSGCLLGPRHFGGERAAVVGTALRQAAGWSISGLIKSGGGLYWFGSE